MYVFVMLQCREKLTTCLSYYYCTVLFLGYFSKFNWHLLQDPQEKTGFLHKIARYNKRKQLASCRPVSIVIWTMILHVGHVSCPPDKRCFDVSRFIFENLTYTVSEVSWKLHSISTFLSFTRIINTWFLWITCTKIHHWVTSLTEQVLFQ